MFEFKSILAILVVCNVAASQKEEPSDLTSAFCAKCFEPSHNMCDRAQLMNPSIPIPCMKSLGDCPARYDCEPAGRHLSKRQMISMLQTFNDAVSDWAVDCLKCYGLDSNLAKYADITKRCENIS